MTRQLLPNNSSKAKIAINKTSCWLDKFIIEHNICPFANKPKKENTLFYFVEESSDTEEILSHLIQHCIALDEQAKSNKPYYITSLFILSEAVKYFDDYLDLLELANELLVIQGFEGVFQIASFHPDYCFNGVERDDLQNYTNRSPYPMFHLIAESYLEKVLQNNSDTENIPVRNIEYCRQLGYEKLTKVHTECNNTGTKND